MSRTAVVSLLFVLSALPVAGCTAPPAAAPGAAHEMQAPARVTLVQEDAPGGVRLSLLVTPTDDVEGVVARFAVPPGWIVLDGALEVDLGSLRRGEKRKVELAIRVPPSAGADVVAGVDLHVGALKHHASTSVRVGAERVEPAALRVVEVDKDGPVVVRETAVAVRELPANPGAPSLVE